MNDTMIRDGCDSGESLGGECQRWRRAGPLDEARVGAQVTARGTNFSQDRSAHPLGSELRLFVWSSSSQLWTLRE